SIGRVGDEVGERREEGLVGVAVAEQNGGTAQVVVVGGGEGDEAIGIGAILAAKGVEELLERLRLAGAGALDQFLQLLFHGMVAFAVRPRSRRVAKDGRRLPWDRDRSILLPALKVRYRPLPNEVPDGPAPTRHARQSGPVRLGCIRLAGIRIRRAAPVLSRVRSAIHG